MNTATTTEVKPAKVKRHKPVVNPTTKAEAKTFRMRPVSAFKRGDDVGVGPWKKGLPPESGWWPASSSRMLYVIRYYDVEKEMVSRAYHVSYIPGASMPMFSLKLFSGTRPSWRERAWNNKKLIKELEIEAGLRLSNKVLDSMVADAEDLATMAQHVAGQKPVVLKHRDFSNGTAEVTHTVTVGGKNPATDTCAGRNCTAVRGGTHSPECIADHEETIGRIKEDLCGPADTAP